jgi:putative inorganic carbon (HCO3(-)) transporter
VEIAESLHLSRRRIVALLALAALVALPVAAMRASGPASYRADASVNLTSLASPTADDNEQERVTADFGAALQLPEVYRVASNVTGVSAGAIKKGLSYEPSQSGDIVAVEFEGQSASKVQAVVLAASASALQVLSDQALASAQGAETAARGEAQAAAAALGAFEATPAGAKARQSTLLAAVAQLQLMTEPTESRPGLSAPIDSPLRDLGDTTLRATVSQLQTVVQQESSDLASEASASPEYALLETNMVDALAQWESATSDFLSTSLSTSMQSSESLITVSSAVRLSQIRSVGLDAFALGAAAVLAATIGLAVLEFRRLKRAAAQLVGAQFAGESVPSAGPAPLRDRRPPRMDRLVHSTLISKYASVWIITLVPLSIAIAIGVSTLSETRKGTLALIMAVPVGLAAGILALKRFEWFLVFLLVIRTSLDALNISSTSSGSGVDPGAAVGAVFIVAAGLWLAMQKYSGTWFKLSRTTLWLWAFAGTCLLSCVASGDRTNSMVETSKVLAGVLMFSVLEQYLGSRPERVKLIITCLYLSFIVPVLVGLHQWVAGTGTRFYADASRVSGTYPHPSSFAIYLLMVIPLSVMLLGYYEGWRRYVLVAVTSLSTLLLIATYTRAAWFAGLAIVVYLGMRGRPQLLLAAGVLIVVLLVAVPSVAGRFADLKSTPVNVVPGQAPPNSLAWRIEYWQLVLPLADSNPITGIGFGQVQVVEPDKLPPHNGFIEAYVETGVLGLVAVTGVVLSLGSALRKRLRESEPGFDRMLALAAIATAIGIIIQFFVENLLDQTFIFWYMASAMTWGYRGGAVAPNPPGTEQIEPLSSASRDELALAPAAPPW